MIEKNEEKIYEKYNTVMLSRPQCAEILGVSVSTLDRMRAAGWGPRYFKKETKGKNGGIKYPLNSICEYINNINSQLKL